MLPESRTLEPAAADTLRGKRETGREDVPLYNIGEGSEGESPPSQDP
jgi:hypothetical protein